MKKTTLFKTVLLLCALVVGSGSAWADTKTEGFEAATAEQVYNTTKTVSTTDSDCGIAWSLYYGCVSINDKISGSNSAQMRYYTSMTGLPYIYTTTAINNLSNVSFKARVSDTHIKMDVSYSSDGETWTVQSTQGSALSFAATNTAYNFSVDLPSGSKYVKIGFGSTSSGQANKSKLIVDDVVFTYTAGGGGDTPDPEPVAVTGVELDQTSLTMEIGDEETLTATVAPNDATNKSVTWESDDTDVATVEDGVVTAVGAGTCTITVTTTDGSFTDECTVTVKAAPVSNAAITWDFDSNIFTLPVGSSNKTVAATDYTYGDYTINVAGSTGNGYYWHTSGYLIIGKEGASITFPAFNFNVNKIKIYGRSGASTKVTFNIFVGDETVSTEATSSVVDHEFAIDAAYQTAGNVYIFKVTGDANAQITKIEIFGYVNAEVGTNGYATFANGNKLDLSNLPEGLTAYKAAVDGDAVKFTAFDQAVPANTGMMLKGDASENPYKIPVIEESTDVTENAFLVNEDGETFEADANYNYFGLKKNTLTFGLFDPATVAIPASKAYLKVAKENPARELVCVFDDGETTGISEAKLLNNNEEIINNNFFDLQGRRVAQPTKGLYIMNGKKVIVK